ncbi:MAG: flagellar hook-basal body complex protein FliE [Candidatus Margulisiibacteriota bacterium]
MAIERINPMDLKLAQLLGEDEVTTPAAAPQVDETQGYYKTSPFEDILGRAVNALEGVSQTEIKANQMIDGYVRGEVDLQDVMVQSSKMNIMVQLATTTVNLAVNTFKEITQMQV